MSMPFSRLPARVLLLLTLLALGGCTIGVQPPGVDTEAQAPPSLAGDKAKQPVVAVNQELSSLQKLLEKNSKIQHQAMANVENRISLLEKEVNELRGDLDLSRRENQQLTSRLAVAENQAAVAAAAITKPQQPPMTAAIAPSPPVVIIKQPVVEAPKPPVIVAQKPPPMAQPAGPPDSAKDSYEAAFLKLRSSKYQEALEEFVQFLKWFPDDNLADNAQYWIGELHFVLKQYPEALQAFNNVLVKWPGSTKIPACLLKIGFAFYELGDMNNAQASLNRLISDYPSSNAVSLAKQRLQLIRERIGRQ